MAKRQQWKNVFIRTYHPDEERQLQALRIILGLPPTPDLPLAPKPLPIRQKQPGARR